MKKIIGCVCVLCLAHVGFGDQISNLVERIERLEKRILVLERGCGIEPEKTPEEKKAEEVKAKKEREERTAKKKAEEVKAKKEREERTAKIKLVDSNVDKFLKEYFGVEVGDDYNSITNKATIVKLMGREEVMIPSIKTLGVFANATCSFTEQKLTGLRLLGEYDSSYSKDSTDEDFKKQLKNFGDLVGVPVGDGVIMRNGHVEDNCLRYEISGEIEGMGGERPRRPGGLLNRKRYANGEFIENGKRYYWIDVSDIRKSRNLRDEKDKKEKEAVKRRNALGKRYPSSK